MVEHPSLLFCDPTIGFHILKDVLTTTTFLRQYCEFLTPNVEITAQVTRAVASLFLRSNKNLSYFPSRPKEASFEDLTHLEDKYERAMFKKWSKENGSPECGWHRLIGYQVPIPDRRVSPMGLKAIDLLAINSSGFPLVVDSRAVAGASRTPLR